MRKIFSDLENSFKRKEEIVYTDSSLKIEKILSKAISDYEISKEEAIKKIKQNTRNYAKRQITWNKKYSDAKKIDMSKNVTDNINKILQK